MLFSNAAAEISQQYSSLGHQLGWRFLYTPARTLNPDIPLFFLGLNPGGDSHHAPQPSVETGNAYRVEAWGANDQPNPLQVQVVALYERVAALLPSIESAALMDRSLAANFCPFRSPSWAKLPARRASIDFSRSLWSRILRDTIPAAFISLTELPARHLVEILRDLGWRQIGNQILGVGWGAVTCSMRTFENEARTTVVVRLPHLSRFRIVGRPGSEEAVEQVTREIATRISQHLA